MFRYNDTVLTIMRDFGWIHNFQNNTKTPVKIEKQTIITAFAVNFLYLVTGSNTGELCVYHSKTGYRMHSLNEVKFHSETFTR